MELWGDILALRLSMTSIAFGLVCLSCVVLAAVVIARRRRSPAGELNDTHAFEVPGLGLVMADGGSPSAGTEWPERDWQSGDDEREYEVGE